MQTTASRAVTFENWSRNATPCHTQRSGPAFKYRNRFGCIEHRAHSLCTNQGQQFQVLGRKGNTFLIMLLPDMISDSSMEDDLIL